MARTVLFFFFVVIMGVVMAERSDAEKGVPLGVCSAQGEMLLDSECGGFYSCSMKGDTAPKFWGCDSGLYQKNNHCVEKNGRNCVNGNLS